MEIAGLETGANSIIVVDLVWIPILFSLVEEFQKSVSQRGIPLASKLVCQQVINDGTLCF